ncbi:hypothetical protein IFM89_016932 [Coptis chinensis]|uniref:Uncharacterized protein n=1 Tax=Coptis chinensis TaxID=261450 RepID=A0A835MA55_9MAGN|nr:hypothetical protein IFM89_016932 [Coptis chinensis]
MAETRRREEEEEEEENQGFIINNINNNDNNNLSPLSSGDQTVWADVSPLLQSACQDLEDGEMIHGENFSLYAAMSALEAHSSRKSKKSKIHFGD